MQWHFPQLTKPIQNINGETFRGEQNVCIIYNVDNNPVCNAYISSRWSRRILDQDQDFGVKLTFWVFFFNQFSSRIHFNYAFLKVLKTQPLIMGFCTGIRGSNTDECAISYIALCCDDKLSLLVLFSFLCTHAQSDKVYYRNNPSNYPCLRTNYSWRLGMEMIGRVWRFERIQMPLAYSTC